MRDDMVVAGIGELGKLFAGGALRSGLRVTPLNRGDDVAATLLALPAGTPILATLPESALAEFAGASPESRRSDIILVQNGLTPPLWKEMGLDTPTIANVWTNKKPGQPLLVGRPTMLYGKHAALMHRIHQALGLNARIAEHPEELQHDLAAKFAFILTINALGYEHRGAAVGELLEDHAEAVDEWLKAGAKLGAARLKSGSVDVEHVVVIAREAMTAMASMPAAGRSAPARLAAAREEASAWRIAIPETRV